MKRLFIVLTVTGVVGIGAAMPASAQAYGGGPGLSCTHETVVGDHFPANTSPTVFVDGSAVGQAQVGQDGSFSFPLPDSVGPGNHTIAVQGTTVKTVCSVDEVLGTTVVKTPPKGTAFTGAAIVTPALIAIALFAAGLVSLFAARRRRRLSGAAQGSGGDDPTR